MAKDRIDRDELASKGLETASTAEDPLRAMAEMIAALDDKARQFRERALGESH